MTQQQAREIKQAVGSAATQKVHSLRLYLELSIEVDKWPLSAPEMRDLRQQLMDAGDVEWLKSKGWQIV